MANDLLLNLLLAICAGAGVYAAIRADLREAIIKADVASKSAHDAHTRMTSHIENHHTMRGGSHG